MKTTENNLKILLILILISGFINFGATCLPEANNPASTNTGNGGNTGGTTGGTTGDTTGGGTQAADNITGEWNGTYQETSISMPGPLVSGKLHFIFNQNNNMFSGNGYFQENGMPMQVPLNGFSNGVISGGNINFSIENVAGNTGGSDKFSFSGSMNGTMISGTFERDISAPGRPTVHIKGNFSIQAGGTGNTGGGAAAVNVTGLWEGTYQDTQVSGGPLGSGIISFDFTQNGSSITGTGVNLTVNGTYAVTGGNVSGYDINFSLIETSNDPNDPWTSTIFDFGVVSGNTITGTYEATTSLQYPYPQTIYAKGNFTLNKK